MGQRRERRQGSKFHTLWEGGFCIKGWNQRGWELDGLSLSTVRWECVSVFDGALISRIPRALVLFLIGLYFFYPQKLYSVGQGAIVEFAAC